MEKIGTPRDNSSPFLKGRLVEQCSREHPHAAPVSASGNIGEGTNITGRSDEHIELIDIESFFSTYAIKVQPNSTCSTSITSEGTLEPFGQYSGLVLTPATKKPHEKSLKDEKELLQKASKPPEEAPKVISDAISPEQVIENLKRISIRSISVGKQYQEQTDAGTAACIKTIKAKPNAASSTSIVSENNAKTFEKHPGSKISTQNPTEIVVSNGKEYFGKDCVPKSDMESVLKTVISDFFAREGVIDHIRKRYEREEDAKAASSQTEWKSGLEDCKDVPKIPRVVTIAKSNSSTLDTKTHSLKEDVFNRLYNSRRKYSTARNTGALRQKRLRKKSERQILKHSRCHSSSVTRDTKHAIIKRNVEKSTERRGPKEKNLHLNTVAQDREHINIIQKNMNSTQVGNVFDRLYNYRKPVALKKHNSAKGQMVQNKSRKNLDTGASHVGTNRGRTGIPSKMDSLCAPFSIESSEEVLQPDQNMEKVDHLLQKVSMIAATVHAEGIPTSETDSNFMNCSHTCCMMGMINAQRRL